MKKTNIPSPVSLLLSIVDEEVARDVEKYLNKKGLNSGIIFMGKGTAESDIADIFGFGMSDKEIIACIIPSAKKTKIINDINEITGVETDNYGLNMILKLQSASSNLLDIMKIKVDSDGKDK